MSKLRIEKKNLTLKTLLLYLFLLRTLTPKSGSSVTQALRGPRNYFQGDLRNYGVCRGMGDPRHICDNVSVRNYKF